MKTINEDVDIRTLTNNSLPWFRFYAKDWKNNGEVLTMSMNERGIYLTMLVAQWDNNNKLPANPLLIAKMCNVETRVITKFLAKWSHLFPIFHDTVDCECGASWSGVASELGASSLHFCKQLANPKLCNIRIDIEIQDLKRVDKTTRNNTRSNNTETKTTEQKPKPQSSSSSSSATIDKEQKPADVQLVLDSINILPGSYLLDSGGRNIWGTWSPTYPNILGLPE
jgi:uncharacterized protein YdaU (DUF1376 family)